jgi:hypothetical protein
MASLSCDMRLGFPQCLGLRYGDLENLWSAYLSPGVSSVCPRAAGDMFIYQYRFPRFTES